MTEKKNKKNSLWLLIALLLFSVVITTVVLVDKFNDYLMNDKGAISLIPPHLDDFNDESTDGNNSSSNGSATVYTPSLEVDDHDNITWGAKTEITLFSVSYENDQKEIFIESSNLNDKIVAPGSDRMYMFKLKNTGDVALDYNLKIDAYVTPKEYQIPLQSSIRRYDGKYILGDKENTKDMIALDKAFDISTVGAGRYVYYVFEWEWPFEGDDEFDTYLGNETIQQNISCTIEISTEATISVNPDDTTGIRSPYTGDTTNVALWMLMLMGSALLLFILFYARREKEDEA